MNNIAFVKKSNQIRDVAFVEQSLPTLQPDECLIKVNAVGICGSDLHMYEGAKGYEWIDYPLVLGHEVTGTIVEVGTDKAKNFLSKRIVIDPYRSCGVCDFCKRGETNRCDNGSFKIVKTPIESLRYGFREPGGLAKYMVAKIDNCIIIGDAISDGVAAISEALAVSYTAVTKITDYQNKKILVVGPGPIGLGVLAILIGKGNQQVDMIGTSVDKERLELACKIGARQSFMNPEEIINQASFSGYDAVIDCSAHPSVPAYAVKMLQRGGQLVLVGINKADFSIAMDQIVRGEITIHGSYGITRKNYEEVLELGTQSAYPFDKLVAKKVAFSDAVEGFELALNKISGKVVVSMEDL